MHISMSFYSFIGIILLSHLTAFMLGGLLEELKKEIADYLKKKCIKNNK